VSSLDHLLPFIDNGGRRSYTERRRNSKIAGRIPDRRTGEERRINDDRRKHQNNKQLMTPERRAVFG
jgi:hypothetical protein